MLPMFRLLSADGETDPCTRPFLIQARDQAIATTAGEVLWPVLLTGVGG